jgi:hypothetical protein
MEINLNYPRSCPFCLSVDLKMLELDRDAWAVECLACQAIGPISQSAPEALTAWNGQLQAEVFNAA